MLKVLLMKAQNFHSKLTCQKPILGQIEWRVQKGSFTKNADENFFNTSEILKIRY